MLLALAVIVLLLWIRGFALSLFGSFIHLLLVLAVILAIAHFVTGRRAAV